MKATIDEDVFQRFKKVRNDREISQRLMSVILDIPRAAISQIENGQREVYADEIYRWCKVLNISSDWLLFGE